MLTGSCVHRWAYLESGIEKIMTNLKDGVDMVTVRYDRSSRGECD